VLQETNCRDPIPMPASCEYGLVKMSTVVGCATSADPSRTLSSEAASSTINRFGLYKLSEQLGGNERTNSWFLWLQNDSWSVTWTRLRSKRKLELRVSRSMQYICNVAYRFQIPALRAFKPSIASILILVQCIVVDRVIRYLITIVVSYIF
jgi:hypothetical protein